MQKNEVENLIATMPLEEEKNTEAAKAYDDIIRQYNDEVKKASEEFDAKMDEIDGEVEDVNRDVSKQIDAVRVEELQNTIQP